MIKRIVKKLIPRSILERRNRAIGLSRQREFAGRPVAETFSEIYEQNLWGGTAGEFYSGTGSDESVARPYAEMIEKFIAEKKIGSVVDLGCGDFRVASQFVSDEINYVGCDVVPSLIDFLQKEHARKNVEFRCLNVIDDELPDGDLCLIRQVLQHLANDEISLVLEKCKKFKYLLVTEHYPAPDAPFTENLDLGHGPGTRLYRNSAVCLDKPPFNLTNVAFVGEIVAEENTRIKTFLIANGS